MKRRFWGSGGAVVVLLLLGRVTTAEARDDWEYWFNEQVEITLQEKLALKWSQDIRLQDDMRNFYVVNPNLSLVWKMEKFLELGSGYKYQYTKTSSGKHTDENQLFWDITLKSPFRGWNLTNRHRIER
ncbi:MAG: DUF2490 domain-containing protein, partial [Candidatus Omnitrophota bacterium]